MFNFKFSNLCGTVYTKGDVVFTPDGNSLLSPVGNRITVFDLANHSSVTLPVQNRKNIAHIAITPDSSLILSIDEEGHAILINYFRRVILARINFKNKVSCLKFSHSGKFFAIGCDNFVEVWHTPSRKKEYAPFVLFKRFRYHHDEVVCLEFSDDDSFLLSGSRDTTARLLPLTFVPKFHPTIFSGHRTRVMGCFFSADRRHIYTVTKDGSVHVWTWQSIEEDEEEDIGEFSLAAIAQGCWKLQKRHFLNHQNAHVVHVSFHKASNLLITGMSNGVFGIYEMPECNNIHTLSISNSKISATAINTSGEWLAFGCSIQGQLLVWEWQSETFVLKQQGHFHDMQALAYSPDSQYLATGDSQGKVKLWAASSGFCFVTFSDHNAAISALQFSPQGHSIFSASLDGTVRAYDLIRYRNFRTFKPPHLAQLSCIAIDPSGEIVVAGSTDPFEIFVWSVQTSKLLDVLTGHEAPISAVAFSPMQPFLASSSWDGTLKFWDIFAKRSVVDSCKHTNDVLALCYRGDGKQVCTSSLDGHLRFWDVDSGDLVGEIDCRGDLIGGRKSTDRRTSKTTAEGKYFTTVTYSTDGGCVLAGGKTKFVCLYEVTKRLLLKKFEISSNRSMDGVLDMLNSRRMTAAGPMDLMEPDYDSDEDRKDESLPGVKVGKHGLTAKRAFFFQIETKELRFAPTGRAWAAVTTEGLMIYSLDEFMVFDPFDLDVDITPDSVRDTLLSKEYLRAIVMALKLNEKDVITKVFYGIPAEQIQLVVGNLPVTFLQRLLSFIAESITSSKHVEFVMLWCQHVFHKHGVYLKENSSVFMGIFRNLQKGATQHYEDLSKMYINQFSTFFMQNIIDKSIFQTKQMRF
eukprot:TRINITY_DN1258_c0_g1_i3.p1 TRINITY_DN1258_c0_g1~~TRINITY_DN1258_c0_g1_i3.p1  ORF type:complete len:857 (+),score=141.38 TRINITY_DN1258_c0_g1_i3:50-2620(+)